MSDGTPGPFLINWWRTGYAQNEIDALDRAVRGERLSQGTITEEFESAFAAAIGARFAVATTSGSVALWLALKSADIGPGDEVIVPNRTWVATAHAVLLAGAQVRLVDVLPDAPLIDTAAVEAALTPRTKALLPVHLNGRACDLAALRALAAKHGLVLIEDACQAMFSEHGGRKLGTFGDFGCFSLGVTKLITTAQGGVVVTNDEALWKRLKLLRNHGVVDNFTEAWGGFGFNFKFTDLQAALGLTQLAKAQTRCAHLRAIYARYAEGLRGLNPLAVIPVRTESGELPLYAEVLAENRNGLIDHLRTHGIQSRPLPPSLNFSPYFGNDGAYPRSEPYAAKGLYLPCGPEQPISNVDRTIEVIRQYCAGA